MDLIQLVKARRGIVPSNNPGGGNERNLSQGGPPYEGPVVTLRPGVSYDRAPGNTNDTLIQYSRGPWFHQGYYIGPGQGVVDWTKSGPSRPSLHMWRRTWNPTAGWSGQTNEGMHTMIPAQNPQLQQGKTPMQRYQRPFLTVQRYRGQSYSQTTKVL